VRLHDAYRDHGFDGANRTGAFLRLLTDIPVAFAAGQVGGLATPDTTLGALSAVRGAIPEGFAQTAAPPNLSAIFAGAKLLGIVAFSEIIDRIADAPTMVTRRAGDTITIEYALHADLKQAGYRSLNFQPGATIDLLATTSTSAPGAATGRLPQSTVSGTVTGVQISIGDVVTVTFPTLRFKAVTGTKPEIATDGCVVAFSGDLSFVQALANALPSTGFGPSAWVNVGPADPAVQRRRAAAAVRVLPARAPVHRRGALPRRHRLLRPHRRRP
jgi:hypothetical protein